MAAVWTKLKCETPGENDYQIMNAVFSLLAPMSFSTV